MPMEQARKQEYGRVGASLIVIAALLFIGTVLLVEGGDGREAVAGVLLAAGAGLATTVALATARGRSIPRWAKWSAWMLGVVGGLALFQGVSPIAAGMIAAGVGLIPTWPRLDNWIRGQDQPKRSEISPAG